MEARFSIKEVYSTSWKSLKEQIWVIVGIYIAFAIVSSVLSLVLMPAQTSSKVGSIIITVITVIISLIFTLGFMKNLFQALDGEEPQFSAYGKQAHKILTLFVASLIYAIVVTIGLCIIIVPGIYLALRLQFFQAAIVEEDAGITSSLRRSWSITKGEVMHLFLLFLLQIAITIIGLCILIVGIFVAAPLVNMMQCATFRHLIVPVETQTAETVEAPAEESVVEQTPESSEESYMRKEE